MYITPRIKFITLCTIAGISLQLFSNTPNPKIPKCEVPGMVGQYDPIICRVMKELVEYNEGTCRI